MSLWQGVCTLAALSLTFIDFCAGIGSTRLALEQCSARCVGFSEIDPVAEQTYRLFFGHDDPNFGDLMKIDPDQLPYFDIMLGGFPCQSFSIMGQRKGMADARGQIILGLANILTKKRPSAFILENVKGLLNHDNGQTLSQIVDLLQSCGYVTRYRLMKSVDIGVPQMRERVFITGIRDDLTDDYELIAPTNVSLMPLKRFLVDRDPELVLDLDSRQGQTFLKYLDNKYNSGEHDLATYLRKPLTVLDTRQSDLRIYRNAVPTLRTGRHGILYVSQGQLRRLSGMEALLLQGFPLEQARLAKRHVSDRNLLSQAGNAMTIPMVQFVAQHLLSVIQPATAPSGHTADRFALAA
ncbi:MAG: DNA (cytosine-5-)-methyltransferase [Planctomycetaceae bacterium]